MEVQHVFTLCQLPDQTLLGEKTKLNHRQDLEMAYGLVPGVEGLPGRPRQI